MSVNIERFTINNKNAYRYYRIYIYGSSGGNGRASIEKIQFFEKPVDPIPPSWRIISDSLPNMHELDSHGMNEIVSLQRKIIKINKIAETYNGNDGNKNNTFLLNLSLKSFLDIRNINMRNK